MSTHPSTPDRQTIRESVQRRYGAAARSGGCCGTAELDLGCGNPLPFAEIRRGDTVLDLGSGSGAEVLAAARMVGPTGRAIGVDVTDAMLERARGMQKAAGIENAEFLKGEIEALPLPDESVDVIVSNCVLNLSWDKGAALKEAFRVLRPGGRLVVADVVVQGGAEPDPAWRADMDGWASCVSGALTEAAYGRFLSAAGFVDVRLERISEYDESGCGGSPTSQHPANGCGCDSPAGESAPALASDLISARKPLAAA